MTLVPLPGANEAELAAKVGSSVIKGLKAAGQPSPWPDTREALLELHAILHEWVERSAATTRYADLLIGLRLVKEHETYASDLAAVSSADDYGHSLMAASNLSLSSLLNNERDTRDVLQGKVPPLQRLRGSSRRRASRRGLRAILAAYCPELLEQFESATTARREWATDHRGDFKGRFDDLSDAQIAELKRGMEATHAALAETERQLGEFIRVSFPLQAGS